MLLLVFFADVFDQSVEPYVSLLITRASITDCKILVTKLFFTRSIGRNFLTHYEVKLGIRSLYDRYESNVIPKSLASL